jgi:NitT/TauT family transport system ATP-binding protein
MTEPATHSPDARVGTPTVDAAVRVVDLVKDFGTDVHAIGGVSFDVPRGELTSIIGPSGCGKTTTLKVIAGLAEPTSGHVEVEGRPVTGPGPDRAMVFQDFALLPWATVLRNAAFGLELKGVPRRERESVAREYVAKVGLAGHEDVYPHQLSGGMRQRVGLARALAVDADILLMDEPFASVDEQIRRKFQEDLLNLLSDEDKTVIFVTHSIEEAVYVSDQIVLLTRGPSTVSNVVRPGLDHSAGSDSVRRSTAYLDWVERIWQELESYLEG